MAILFGLLNVRFRDTHHLAEIGSARLVLPDADHDIDPPRWPGVAWPRATVQSAAPFLNLLRRTDPVRADTESDDLRHRRRHRADSRGAAMVALKIEERRLIFHL